SGRRKERGRVELIRVVAVESVDTAVFQRDFVFQLCYLSEDDDQYVLYIAAPTAQDREQWLDYIRKLVADNDCLSDKYHQGAFIKSQWSCCKGGKNTIACTDVTWTINHNNNPPVTQEKVIFCTLREHYYLMSIDGKRGLEKGIAPHKPTSHIVNAANIVSTPLVTPLLSTPSVVWPRRVTSSLGSPASHEV
ncbi:tyrosine-protein kinase ITK/TSK-like, partial [Penaeus indicus]|uniref:tyrosine-protein kinase ITK/TSK-like n=1 Tax=Penaeus indicus TaxID=29960 RepID=UPI00300CE8F8